MRLKHRVQIEAAYWRSRYEQLDSLRNTDAEQQLATFRVHAKERAEAQVPYCHLHAAAAVPAGHAHACDLYCALRQCDGALTLERSVFGLARVYEQAAVIAHLTHLHREQKASAAQAPVVAEKKSTGVQTDHDSVPVGGTSEAARVVKANEALAAQIALLETKVIKLVNKRRACSRTHAAMPSVTRT